MGESSFGHVRQSLGGITPVSCASLVEESVAQGDISTADGEKTQLQLFVTALQVQNKLRQNMLSGEKAVRSYKSFIPTNQQSQMFNIATIQSPTEPASFEYGRLLLGECLLTFELSSRLEFRGAVQLPHFLSLASCFHLLKMSSQAENIHHSCILFYFASVSFFPI